MIESRSNFSRRMLIRLIVLGAVVAVALVANYQFINELYLKNQQTPVGMLVNGAILVVFVLGLIKIITSLSWYMQEEVALVRFVRQFSSDPEKLMKGVSPKSVIARRHATIQTLSEKHARINHSALAATLQADESARISFTRYVSNILILTGVFGTIVSLSVALLGASNIIDSADGMGSMGMVIHGMSTALSTTTTAIVCYLFFGYFYLKVTDVQTQLLSGIEQATALYIMPRFTYQTDSMLHEIGNLVRSLRDAAEKMGLVEADFANAGSQMNNMIGTYADSVGNLDDNINEIKQLLRSGFRLPE